jgi:hypothetical protein
MFGYWLDHMDDAVADFRSDLPAEVAAQLDGSPGSLRALEAWLLDRYPSLARARAASEMLAIDGAARYAGEVFRVGLGAEWRLGRVPELDLPIPVCPMVLVTEATNRRTGDYLMSVFDCCACLVGTT